MWSYEPWHVMIYSSFCFSDFKFQSSNFTVTIKIRLMQIDYCALLLIRKITARTHFVGRFVIDPYKSARHDGEGHYL